MINYFIRQTILYEYMPSGEYNLLTKLHEDSYTYIWIHIQCFCLFVFVDIFVICVSVQLVSSFCFYYLFGFAGVKFGAYIVEKQMYIIGMIYVHVQFVTIYLQFSTCPPALSFLPWIFIICKCTSATAVSWEVIWMH